MFTSIEARMSAMIAGTSPSPAMRCVKSSAALKADRLLLLTDVDGVKDADGVVVTEMTPAQIKDMTTAGIIAGGMIPKTETALEAIRGGVRAVVILDGRAPNACLLELFTDHGAGSLIRA